MAILFKSTGANQREAHILAVHVKCRIRTDDDLIQVAASIARNELTDAWTRNSMATTTKWLLVLSRHDDVTNHLPTCIVLLYQGTYRLLHNPSLVALGLFSGGIRHGLQLALITLLWLVGLKASIASCRYALWAHVTVGNFVYQRTLTVPLHSPNGRRLPAVRDVQGDCERV